MTLLDEKPDTALVSKRNNRFVPLDSVRVPQASDVTTNLSQWKDNRFQVANTSDILLWFETYSGHFWPSSTVLVLTGLASQDKLSDEQHLLRPEFYSFVESLRNVSLSEKWLREGILPPTAACKEKAFQIFEMLFSKYRLSPHRVAASVEEGIMLLYKHSRLPRRTLAVEVYNDLDVAGILNEGNQIVQSTIIENLRFDPIIERFNA